MQICTDHMLTQCT